MSYRIGVQSILNIGYMERIIRLNGYWDISANDWDEWSGFTEEQIKSKTDNSENDKLS
ncbi:hypothetical protein [Paenibacillus sp. FSL R5-0701]|uniref:hypothetical protein n=1 Tax=Paenibacillus sp. FSL R5-0701 TaxID=2921654 RepID=UPI0030CB182F